MATTTKPSSWPLNPIGWIMPLFQDLEFSLHSYLLLFISFSLPLKVSSWASASLLGLARITYQFKHLTYASPESRTHLSTRLVLSSRDPSALSSCEFSSHTQNSSLQSHRHEILKLNRPLLLGKLSFSLSVSN